MERQHKRELRLESAQKATKIAVSSQADLERTLLFNLRMAFVQTLQEKAVLNLAKENLAYYDQVLAVSRDRYRLGADCTGRLAPSGTATGTVRVRLAKRGREPADREDSAACFAERANASRPVRCQRAIRLLGATPTSRRRPPVSAGRAAGFEGRVQSVDKANTDHRLAWANGSTDPTIGFDVGRNPPIDHYFGFNVSIPLAHLRSQSGRKAAHATRYRTATRTVEATRAQVFSDVDSAYATVLSTVILLKPYKERYLKQADRFETPLSFPTSTARRHFSIF